MALIGHVANGKTTLVKALTNVNTKRRSDEMKSGRTIKLGYANCLVWKCPTCNKVSTTGQAQKKYSCCNRKIDLPVQYISLTDCPGHHSFVTNMIKGVSIVDCAILVTDVRKAELQIQTLEHLAILEILGVTNVIVVQNKVDLVSSEQCYTHYKMLREQLQKTIAENSPIIPISAQTGLGIDNIQKYIYDMIETLDVTTTSSNLFSVIRSFDINKPGSTIDMLKGGVLGGTTLGEGFKVGDKLEIKPGVCINGIYRPLTIQVRSIFSENKSLQHTVRGGLYGIGTTLDSSLTKNDGLAGSLVGKSVDLPDIKHEISMKIVRVRLSGDKIPSIKKNKIYRLIFGSNVVKGSCKSKNKPYVVMKLTRPICSIDKKCLIYSSDTNLLIAFGIIDEENEKEGENKKEKNSMCLQSEEEYIKIIPTKETVQKKSSIPTPITVRENRNTIWSNLTVFCQTINRQEGQVVSYVKQELCANVNVCSNGLRLLKTKINSTRLQRVLKGFVVTNVMCDQCKGLDTEIRKNKVITELFCKTCNSTRPI